MNSKVLFALLGTVLIIVGLSYVLSLTNEPTPGAVPVLSSPICINGVCTHYYSLALISGSTTPASIRLPSATSTMISATLNVTTSSSSAQRWVIAWGATPYATTTVLGDNTFVASGQGAVIATSTPASYTGTGMAATLFAPSPSSYINVSMQGGSGGASLNAPVGTLEVVVRTVSPNR